MVDIGHQTYLDTFLSMMPSPSSGIFVTFLNLNFCSCSNCSNAWQVMSTNLLLDDGN